jgi:hypothetical protein
MTINMIAKVSMIGIYYCSDAEIYVIIPGLFTVACFQAKFFQLQWNPGQLG